MHIEHLHIVIKYVWVFRSVLLCGKHVVPCSSLQLMFLFLLLFLQKKKDNSLLVGGAKWKLDVSGAVAFSQSFIFKKMNLLKLQIRNIFNSHLHYPSAFFGYTWGLFQYKTAPTWERVSPWPAMHVQWQNHWSGSKVSKIPYLKNWRTLPIIRVLAVDIPSLTFFHLTSMTHPLVKYL